MLKFVYLLITFGTCGQIMDRELCLVFALLVFYSVSVRSTHNINEKSNDIPF